MRWHQRLLGGESDHPSRKSRPEILDQRPLDLEAGVLEHAGKLGTESLRLPRGLPSRSLTEQVHAPTRSELLANDVEGRSGLVECRHVNREDLVIDLVPEIGLLDAGRDEPRLVRVALVAPQRQLDHLRRAVDGRDPPAIEPLADQ